MKNIIVLMTALLPTTGHADLINFAANIPDAKVHVLINGRTFEPIPSLHRWQDLHDHFKNFPNVYVAHSVEDSAPQNPEDMPDGFFEWWKDEINTNFPIVGGHWDYVVAAEPYGHKVAETLNARFVPYDLGRIINPARGTSTRNSPWELWEHILPETRRRYMIKATMFGQESVGKTTMAKAVAEKLNARWIPEYAREYLETVGPEVTAEAMENIHAGQAALQRSNFANVTKPALLLDTDLFSTVGYYNIMKIENAPEDLVRDAHKFASDVYYVLPDDIPFEPDILRYGDGVRESDTHYWIDLLEKYHQNYKIVPKGLTFDQKVQWISEDILGCFYAQFVELSLFERELPSLKSDVHEMV